MVTRKEALPGRYFDGLVVEHFAHLVDNRHPVRRSFTKYALVGFLSEGAFSLQVRGERKIVEAPALWFGHRNQLYNVEPLPGRKWEHWYVAISGRRLKTWEEQGLWPRKESFPAVTIDRPASMRLRWIELLGILQAAPRGNPRVTHLLEGLLLDAGETTPFVPSGPRGDPLLRQLEDQCHVDWNFRTYAAETGRSYSAFRHQFKEETGLSPLKFLLECRLQRSLRLLRLGRESVQACAKEAGFGHLSLFARQFKRRFGMLPSEVRRERNTLGRRHAQVLNANDTFVGIGRSTSHVPKRLQKGKNRDKK